MCGIFGIIPGPKTALTKETFTDQVDQLVRLSQSRGKDASGLAIVTNEEILYCKSPIPATQLIRKAEVRALLRHPYDHLSKASRPVAVIGHARMETNGSFANNDNNQPVIRDGLVTLHNGIVVNDRMIWDTHTELQRRFQVDTEVINALFRRKFESVHSIIASANYIFSQIEGSASLSILFDDVDYLLLATNTGSLYTAITTDGTLYFVSEKYFLEALAAKQHWSEKILSTIQQVPSQTGIVIHLDNGQQEAFIMNKDRSDAIEEQNNSLAIKKRSVKHIALATDEQYSRAPIINSNTRELEKKLERLHAEVHGTINKLQRCTICILPETMPFITFDERGVCSYCRNNQPNTLKSQQALSEIIAPYRKNNGQPDCIVPFSGGRDSSYGLHVAVKELGLHPVAFSYDWGMLTDLGRRNQARMCGALGVEHILISADIRQKRTNIKKNVLAWLRRPHLGTIPLFMAGDKQYFYYLNKLQKQMHLPLSLYLENRLEKTDFKSGFCGIRPRFNIGHGYNLGLTNKIKMAMFYSQQYLRNPSLINSSILDTVTAFLSSYFISHEYVFLFHFLPWRENDVEETIINNYNWETSPDIPTTWRIGDGTAPFYNLIYYTVAGFTENDTFRSNQIREGHMTRAEALEKVERENTPSIEPIRWYCETVGLDLDYVLERIGTMKKRFLQVKP